MLFCRFAWYDEAFWLLRLIYQKRCPVFARIFTATMNCSVIRIQNAENWKLQNLICRAYEMSPSVRVGHGYCSCILRVQWAVMGRPCVMHKWARGRNTGCTGVGCGQLSTLWALLNPKSTVERLLINWSLWKKPAFATSRSILNPK